MNQDYFSQNINTPTTQGYVDIQAEALKWRERKDMSTTASVQDESYNISNYPQEMNYFQQYENSGAAVYHRGDSPEPLPPGVEMEPLPPGVEVQPESTPVLNENSIHAVETTEFQDSVSQDTAALLSEDKRAVSPVKLVSEEPSEEKASTGKAKHLLSKAIAKKRLAAFSSQNFIKTSINSVEDNNKNSSSTFGISKKSVMKLPTLSDDRFKEFEEAEEKKISYKVEETYTKEINKEDKDRTLQLGNEDAVKDTFVSQSSISIPKFSLVRFIEADSPPPTISEKKADYSNSHEDSDDKQKITVEWKKVSEKKSKSAQSKSKSSDKDDKSSEKKDSKSKHESRSSENKDERTSVRSHKSASDRKYSPKKSRRYSRSPSYGRSNRNRHNDRRNYGKYQSNRYRKYGRNPDQSDSSPDSKYKKSKSKQYDSKKTSRSGDRHRSTSSSERVRSRSPLKDHKRKSKTNEKSTDDKEVVPKVDVNVKCKIVANYSSGSDVDEKMKKNEFFNLEGKNSENSVEDKPILKDGSQRKLNTVPVNGRDDKMIKWPLKFIKYTKSDPSIAYSCKIVNNLESSSELISKNMEGGNLTSQLIDLNEEKTENTNYHSEATEKLNLSNSKELQSNTELDRRSNEKHESNIQNKSSGLWKNMNSDEPKPKVSSAEEKRALPASNSSEKKKDNQKSKKSDKQNIQKSKCKDSADSKEKKISSTSSDSSDEKSLSTSDEENRKVSTSSNGSHDENANVVKKKKNKQKSKKTKSLPKKTSVGKKGFGKEKKKKHKDSKHSKKNDLKRNKNDSESDDMKSKSKKKHRSSTTDSSSGASDIESSSQHSDRKLKNKKISKQQSEKIPKKNKPSKHQSKKRSKSPSDGSTADEPESKRIRKESKSSRRPENSSSDLDDEVLKSHSKSHLHKDTRHKEIISKKKSAHDSKKSTKKDADSNSVNPKVPSQINELQFRKHVITIDDSGQMGVIESFTEACIEQANIQNLFDQSQKTLKDKISNEKSISSMPVSEKSESNKQVDGLTLAKSLPKTVEQSETPKKTDSAEKIIVETHSVEFGNEDHSAEDMDIANSDQEELPEVEMHPDENSAEQFNSSLTSSPNTECQDILEDTKLTAKQLLERVKQKRQMKEDAVSNSLSLKLKNPPSGYFGPKLPPELEKKTVLPIIGKLPNIKKGLKCEGGESEIKSDSESIDKELFESLQKKLSEKLAGSQIDQSTIVSTTNSYNPSTQSIASLGQNPCPHRRFVLCSAYVCSRTPHCLVHSLCLSLKLKCNNLCSPRHLVSAEANFNDCNCSFFRFPKDEITMSENADQIYGQTTTMAPVMYDRTQTTWTQNQSQWMPTSAWQAPVQHYNANFSSANLPDSQLSYSQNTSDSAVVNYNTVNVAVEDVNSSNISSTIPKKDSDDEEPPPPPPGVETSTIMCTLPIDDKSVETHSAVNENESSKDHGILIQYTRDKNVTSALGLEPTKKSVTFSDGIVPGSEEAEIKSLQAEVRPISPAPPPRDDAGNLIELPEIDEDIPPPPPASSPPPPPPPKSTPPPPPQSPPPPPPPVTTASSQDQTASAAQYQYTTPYANQMYYQQMPYGYGYPATGQQYDYSYQQTYMYQQQPAQMYYPVTQVVIPPQNKSKNCENFMSEGPFIKFQEVFQHPADLQDALNRGVKEKYTGTRSGNPALENLLACTHFTKVLEHRISWPENSRDNHNFFLTRCCLEQNQPRETPMDFLYCNILPFPTPILNSAERPLADTTVAALKNAISGIHGALGVQSDQFRAITIFWGFHELKLVFKQVLPGHVTEDRIYEFYENMKKLTCKLISFHNLGTEVLPSASNNRNNTDFDIAAIAVTGLDDKRKITGVIGISVSGNLLPLQLIYEGKTNGYHLNYRFLDDWHITHSENHRSTIITKIDYVNNIVSAYLDDQCKNLDLPIIQALKAHGMEVNFVPA
ncbi:G patch domain-containing protein 8 [Nymphon striatum]|nr:G patch domain-containing protein 8 [Nymphon striatum]